MRRSIGNLVVALILASAGVVSLMAGSFERRMGIAQEDMAVLEDYAGALGLLNGLFGQYPEAEGAMLRAEHADTVAANPAFGLDTNPTTTIGQLPARSLPRRSTVPRCWCLRA